MYYLPIESNINCRDYTSLDADDENVLRAPIVINIEGVYTLVILIE